MHGITIRENGATVTPNIYVDGMKEAGLSVEEAVDTVAKTYEENKDPVTDLPDLQNWDEVKDRLCVRLVPNSAYLKDKLTFDYLDLKGVFFVEVMDGGAITITTQLADEWGVELVKIKQQAIANTKRLLPVVGRGMFDVLSEITNGEIDESIPEDIPLLVFTNAKKMWGGNALLIGNFGEKPRYILPSSIHEVLSLDAEGADPIMFREMVAQVNDNEVRPDEILSYSVYYWDGKEMSIA